MNADDTYLIEDSLYSGTISCYVYLVQNASHVAEYQIRFGLDISEINDRIEREGNQLVYLRHFDNIPDGIGHKIYLESVSKRTLTQLIVKNRSSVRKK